MNFSYTEEQRALQDTLRRYIANEYGFAHRRAVAASSAGFDRRAWTLLGELGVLMLPFPEDLGGLGGNAVDVMLVMEMLGRCLALEPYVTTVVLCGGMLRDAASPSQQEALLPAIYGGKRLMALAAYESGSRYDLGQVATTATPVGERWKLDGAKIAVLGAPAADAFIVSARIEAGLSLFIVEAKAAGLKLRSYSTQDGARAADVRLDGVVVGQDGLLGTHGDGLSVLERGIDHANAALCAEAVGAMSALNEATLQYLKTRRQFGVPIGRFQALQHRMAEMAIAVELARSMAIYAAAMADAACADERRRAVAAAKCYVMSQARFVGQQAVQLHGGMGVVDELDVAHYFKRLTMMGLTYGDIDYHLARFSDASMGRQ